MSDDLERIGRAMQMAWSRIKKAQTKMWGDWMIVGDGLLEGRRWAMQMAGTDKPEGKGYVTNFGEWLKRFKLDDMDKSDRAKLLQLMEERPAVEEWRATLTDWERRNFNNPTIVWRKWTAATKVKKPKPRSAGTSASEHGRAKEMIQQQQARIEELEEESLKPDAPPAEVAEHIIALYPDTAREIAELILKALPKPTAEERAKRMEAAGFRRTKRPTKERKSEDVQTSDSIPGS